MAVTKIHAITATIDKAVAYTTSGRTYCSHGVVHLLHGIRLLADRRLFNRLDAVAVNTRSGCEQ